MCTYDDLISSLLRIVLKNIELSLKYLDRIEVKLQVSPMPSLNVGPTIQTAITILILSIIVDVME